MNIATKLNAGILVVFVASVIANYSVMRATIQPKFEEIEIAASKTNHTRVTSALDALQAKLRSSTQDWGFWDDSYSFARGETTQTFLDSSLRNPAEALGGLGIDTLAIFDAKGSVVWGAAFDTSTKVEISGFAEELKAVGFTHPYLSGVGEAKSVSGLIKTSKGLMLVAVAPITKTDHLGAPAGTIWMGSFLDEGALQELTNVKLRFEDVNMMSPAAGQDLVSMQLSSHISTSSLVSDISGRPIAVLSAETPRDVSAAGAAAIGSAFWLSLAAGALVLLALWLFVKEIVVARIESLTQHFGSAGQNGQIRRTKLNQSNDEIGRLARSFNDLAQEANQLRDVMVCDRAYIGSVSEWATGTLHNIRNGLIPINFAASRAHSAFDTASVENMKSALEQLASPSTTPERREKLITYVLGKTPHMLECAAQVKSMSEDIMAASKAVQDMSSGYEKFIKREINYETIDLLPLLENVAKSAVTSQRSDVQVRLPAQTALTIGNRTLLWQILSNILTNAVEAMERQPQEKRIDIDLLDASGDGGGLRLSISDSGEGIPAEYLETIFDRGFSTRENKVGGLGLHWCANAAKELGGALTAESNGRGTGATLVLSLPSPASKDAELENAA